MIDTRTEALSPGEALRTIQEYAAYEEPVRRRAESVTWMVWGVCTAAFFGTQAVFFDAGGSVSEAAGWISLLIWLVIGVAMTQGVYRLAGVVARSPLAWGRGVLLAAALVLTILVLLDVFQVEAARGAVGMVYALGIVWLVMGLVRPPGVTSTGRLFLSIMGALQIVIGVALVFWFPGFDEQAWFRAYFAATIVNGLIPVIGGVVQGIRG